jgi:hypothetical protein
MPRDAKGERYEGTEGCTQQLLVLQRAFESQLQQTDLLFRAERLARLVELQRRLTALGRRESVQIEGRPDNAT